MPSALHAPVTWPRAPASIVPRPDSVTFRLPKLLFGEDRVILELLRIDRWRRPLYVASTVSPDRVSWLWPFLRLDGLAFRAIPSADTAAWDIDHARRQLVEKVSYAGLTDTTIALDADSRAMCSNYVAALLQLAYAQSRRGDARGSLATLDFLESHVALKRLGTK